MKIVCEIEADMLGFFIELISKLEGIEIIELEDEKLKHLAEKTKQPHKISNKNKEVEDLQQEINNFFGLE